MGTMALNEFYKLVGEVTIPEEKREELNDYVLKLLDRSGVRKIKKVKIGDLDTEVAERVKRYNHGKVFFDYSIYENCVRGVSSYDTDTCALEVNESDFNEMGIAMVMVMTLLESYSITPCYVARENKLIEINRYALMVEDLIGIRLRFPHRADIWTMYVFCKECEEVEEIKGIDLIYKVPSDFEQINYAQFYNALIVEKDSILAEKIKEVIFDQGQIESAKYMDRCCILYSEFLSLEREKKDYGAFIQKLMLMSLEERTKLAEEHSNYGIVAELSRYLSPQVLVKCYSLVKGTDFWSEWKLIAANGFYVDSIDDMDESDEKEHGVFHFYQAIQRNDDDEALGEFGDRKLALSDEMNEEIAKWREKVRKEFPDDLNSLDELKSIVEEIRNVWDARRMDAALFKELKGNPDSEGTQKALLLLKTMTDDCVEIFPELTKSQAKKWVLKRCRSEFDKQKLNALLGLLANKEKRMELLGF